MRGRTGLHHRRSRLFDDVLTTLEQQKNQRSNATLGQSALAGDKSGDGKAISDVDWNARIRGMADELKIADNSFQTYDLLGLCTKSIAAGAPLDSQLLKQWVTKDQDTWKAHLPTRKHVYYESEFVLLALLTQYQVAEQERKDSPLPQQIAAIANAVIDGQQAQGPGGSPGWGYYSKPDDLSVTQGVVFALRTLHNMCVNNPALDPSGDLRTKIKSALSNAHTYVDECGKQTSGHWWYTYKPGDIGRLQLHRCCRSGKTATLGENADPSAFDSNSIEQHIEDLITYANTGLHERCGVLVGDTYRGKRMSDYHYFYHSLYVTRALRESLEWLNSDGCTLDNTIALKKKVYTTITQFGNWHRTWALYEEDGVSAPFGVVFPKVEGGKPTFMLTVDSEKACLSLGLLTSYYLYGDVTHLGQSPKKTAAAAAPSVIP